MDRPLSQEVAVPAALTSLQPVVAGRPDHGAVTGVLAGVHALQVHLQPIVALDTGEVWGVEALARFPGHPQPGPAQWFASALHDGRGPQLEQLALSGALEVLPLLPPRLRLTVNLSARALLRPAVQVMLLEVADSRLVVELTEHEQVADYPALLRVLNRLRDRGVGLGIDDFGAGHSSLQHVLHLEPEVVKLDLALVQGVGECARRQALVDVMIGFCDKTGTVLVAEGVETTTDLAQLARLGVGLAQGWVLARPASPHVLLPGLARVGESVLPSV
jgi:EAL domain-containing protein (putative c-di-GMP-specific phosphodiesterase class I)